MSRVARVAALAAALAATVVLSSCARPGTEESDPTPTPGGSSASPDAATSATPPAPTGATTDMNTLPPSLPQPGKPPRTPTDPMPSDILVGRVTKGGSGPCYAMETDEGVTYALFWGQGVTLSVGDSVVVRYEQMRALVDCGPGTPVSVVKLEIVS
jgi:hypothetical protein